jgi:hypothetical protein
LEAEEALETFDRLSPGSSLVPFYRLRLILLTARKRPDFLRAAAEAVEETMKRNRWECLQRSFSLWMLEWLNRHEADPFIRTSLAVDWGISSGHLIALCRFVYGASFSPGPPSREIRRLSSSLLRLVEDRAFQGPDSAEFLISQVALKTILQAEFLLAWRAGDFETARKMSQKLDDTLMRDAVFEAFFPEHGKPFEPKTWMFTEAFRRLLQPLKDLVEHKETDTDEALRRSKEELEKIPDDTGMKEEAHRRLESGAPAYLGALKRDLTRTAPFLTLLKDRHPSRKPMKNMLNRALSEIDQLEGNPFPEDRQKDLVDTAFGDEEDDINTEATEARRWLIQEALQNPLSAPSSTFTGKLGRSASRDLDVAAILMRRGEATVGLDIDSAAEKAMENPAADSLWGFSRILAHWGQREPGKVAELLPEVEIEYPQDHEALISETLLWATGRDFGMDWDQWRRHFSSPK